MSQANISSITAPGVTGGYDGNSVSLKIVMSLFTGLAIYNALELGVLILLSFSRYQGLYFWSLLVSSFGIIPYSLGFVLKFFEVLAGNWKWFPVALLTVGWYLMVTGQSVVLWSRLHLIAIGDRSQLVLRLTKWMIIVDVLVFHVPTTVVTFGSSGDIDTLNFAKAYNVIEKYQMTGFFIQEVILSSIYIIETIQILQNSLKPNTTRIMHQLILINVVIILMDIMLLGLEYASLYILQIVIKGFIYSVKLKLEFAILGRLVKVFKGDRRPSTPEQTARGGSVSFVEAQRSRSHRTIHDDIPMSDFLFLRKNDTDYTHAIPVSPTHSRRRPSSTTSPLAYEDDVIA